MLESVINVYLENPFGQTLGLLGMLSIMYAFLQEDDSKVIKILFISSFFWTGHFFVMGIYAGLGATLMGAIRLALSLKYKRNEKIFYAIIIATIIVGAMTYKDSSSILPIIAGCFATYGFFFLEKIKLRLLLMICSLFWLSYNYIHFSIGGIANELFVQIIQVYTMYKIIKLNGTSGYYIEKVKSAILGKRRIDYGRYLSIVDYINLKEKKSSLLNILKSFKLRFKK